MDQSCHKNERQKATKASVLWTVVNSKRRTGGQKLRSKHMLLHHLQNVDINQDNWESLASDRLVLRKNVSSGLKKFEDERMKKLEERQHIHQQKAQGVITSQYVRAIGHRDCHYRIGLYALEQAHKRWLNSNQ